MGGDGLLSRYREQMPEPVVYAGAIAMDTAVLDDAPDEPFNFNIYFDKAIARSRLYGMTLQGHWLTVGTPEAIGEAEETIRRLRTLA
jgi:MurNAc alpha-1-phosphate uridylyltransferase